MKYHQEIEALKLSCFSAQRNLAKRRLKQLSSNEVGYRFFEKRLSKNTNSL